MAVFASHLSPQGIAKPAANLSPTSITGGCKQGLIIPLFLSFALIPLAMKKKLRIFKAIKMGIKKNLGLSAWFGFYYGRDRLKNWLGLYLMLL